MFEFLATIWFYLFPVIIIVAIGIVLLKKFLNINNSLILFSKVFLTLLLLAYLCYNYLLFANKENEITNYFKDFMKINTSFYYWVYYIAFFFVLVSVLSSVIQKFLKK